MTCPKCGQEAITINDKLVCTECGSVFMAEKGNAGDQIKQAILEKKQQVATVAESVSPTPLSNAEQTSPGPNIVPPQTAVATEEKPEIETEEKEEVKNEDTISHLVEKTKEPPPPTGNGDFPDFPSPDAPEPDHHGEPTLDTTLDTETKTENGSTPSGSSSLPDFPGAGTEKPNQPEPATEAPAENQNEPKPAVEPAEPVEASEAETTPLPPPQETPPQPPRPIDEPSPAPPKSVSVAINVEQSPPTPETGIQQPGEKVVMPSHDIRMEKPIIPAIQEENNVLYTGDPQQQTIVTDTNKQVYPSRDIGRILFKMVIFAIFVFGVVFAGYYFYLNYNAILSFFDQAVANALDIIGESFE